MAAMRKTVTVLFCDLVDSTGLGEQVDPERFRELLARWYDRMRAPIERHGGTVEKFIGDAVMAVFGVPQVHEDDALRAVLAAVEMAAAAEPPLQVRIGINTGEVVTGDGTTSLVGGDAVNTAKRLEEAAPPGGILIGGATRQLVANAVELDPVGAVPAKGKQSPVEAWRVRETIPGAAPFARRLDAALVGRTDELAFLRAQLGAVERDGVCGLVTIFGSAGVGKSRLARELLAGVGDRALVLTARCLPYGDGISFLPVDDLLRSLGGDDAVLAAVAAEPDGGLISTRLCGEATTAEELQWALRRLLETLAREQPLVACIEDVHWAEPAFLDLLEYVAGWSRAPILLLCLARPDLLDARPRWGGRSLTLAPLSDSDSRSLVASLAAEWPVDEQARDHVVQAAEGNPLFLEQMVAMLAEGHGGDDLPPTVQALLAARLDRLEPAERAVLERASVVGRDFTRAEVAELSPEAERSGLSATLMSLVRRELVQPAPGLHLGDDGFRFRHALIRDAAYAELPKRLRAVLHGRFADWLELNDGEDELVGFHLEQAYRCGDELGTQDELLAHRAGALLARAGTRAYTLDDVQAASNLLTRAATLLPAENSIRLDALVLLGSTQIMRGAFTDAEAMLSEARRAGRRTGDSRIEMRAEIELCFLTALTTQVSAERIVETAERAIAALGEVGDDAGLARAWRLLSEAHVLACRWADRAAALEQAIVHARRAGDRRQESILIGLLAQSLHYGPTPVSEATVRCKQMLAEAEGDRALAAALLSTLGGLYAMRGDCERAHSHWLEARGLYDALGLQHRRAARSIDAGNIEQLCGDLDAAEHELRFGYDTLFAMGETYVRATVAAFLADVLVELERDEEAAALLGECEANASQDDIVAHAVWRGAHARLLARRGDVEGATTLVREAVRLAETTDFLDLRARAYVDLARVLATARPDEAAAAADAARREYRLKGNVVGADRVDELVSTVARDRLR